MLTDEQMAMLAKIEGWERNDRLQVFPVYTYPNSRVIAARWTGEWVVNDSTCWRLLVKRRATLRPCSPVPEWIARVDDVAPEPQSDPAEALVLAILAAHPETHE